MSIDPKTLEALRKEAEANSMWTPTSVAQTPHITLRQWQIFELRGQRHFVGHNYAEHEGRVSSRIVTFDRETLKGVTESGRIYQLSGPMGYDEDAHHVLEYWLQGMKATVDDIRWINVPK